MPAMPARCPEHDRPSQAAYRDHPARHGLDIVEAARLFSAANTASADATITTWNSEFAYALWRPIHAIRPADTDGTPATKADPSREPLISTPPYPGVHRRQPRRPPHRPVRTRPLLQATALITPSGRTRRSRTPIRRMAHTRVHV